MPRSQRWTTPLAIARYFGVTSRTVQRWARRGYVATSKLEHRHYADERARVTDRRPLRIYEADLRAFLESIRAGGASFPSKLWRKG